MYTLDNMVIKVYRNVIDISGSLHIFYNIMKGRGNQNYDDFSYQGMCEAIDLLEARFGIYLRFERLIKLEIGANISVPVNATDVIDRNVVNFNFKTHITGRDYGKDRGLLKEFETSQFWVKLYDKGRHYKLDREILRLELKYRRRDTLVNIGITCMNDLTQIEKFEALVQDYYHRLNNDLLVIDKLDFSGIDKIQTRDALYKGCNTQSWTYSELSTRKGGHRHVSPHTVVNRKKRFKKLLEENNLLTIKTLWMSLIIDKIEELTGIIVTPSSRIHTFSRMTRMK